MTARCVIGSLALFWLSACSNGGGSDGDAPIASAIATAAYSAVGADYPASGVAAGRSTGIADCDAYFKKIDECKGIPPSARRAIKEAATAMRQSVKAATTDPEREQLAESCRQAVKSLSVCDTDL